MKNKEIEELLNEFKNKECYYVGTNGCLYQDLTKEEINLILSHIEQLQNNRDKAIEVLENIPINANGGQILEVERKVLHLLKGDSDE